MAQHGYLNEYDESRDRGDERDRWRDNDRERGWRNEDRDFGDRDRNLMFRGREQGPQSNRFGEEDRKWRGSQQDQWRSEDRGQRDRFGSGWEVERPQSRFRNHQDDHYRSWRQRQIEALDREYEEYCREREQQFHRDFDSWRNDRRNQGSNEAEAVDGELELTHERAISGQGNTPSPVGQATLGTNNSENTNPGPGKPTP